MKYSGYSCSMSSMYYTDYEAVLIYLTVIKHNLSAPSHELRKELSEYPALRFVLKRHSPGSIAMRWTDFRTAVSPDLRPTRGAKLPQVKRIIEDLEFFTGLPLREDMVSGAA